MPRSFQGRMARKDQDRLRTDVMRGIRDQREERNRVGPGIEMMGNVAMSTPETRFNKEFAANQRVGEALAVEQDKFGHQKGMDALDRRIKIGEINMPRTVSRIDPDTGEKYTEEIPGANLNQQGFPQKTLNDVMGAPEQEKARANVWDVSGQRIAGTEAQNPYAIARQGLGANVQEDPLSGQIATDSGVPGRIVQSQPQVPGGALKPYPQQAFIPRLFQGTSQAIFGQSPADRRYSEPDYAAAIRRAREEMKTGRVY